MVLFCDLHPKIIQRGRSDATHVVTPNTHIILPQYCCQLNTITALNTRIALFIQPMAVWQREMITSCDNFPISSLITVTGLGLRLLPAADGWTAEELQRLLSGLGRSTEECLFRSIGAVAEIFQPETSNPDKVNGGKTSVFVTCVALSWTFFFWSRKSSAGGVNWVPFDVCWLQNPQSLNQTLSAKT